MTLDINSRRTDLKSEVQISKRDEQTEITPTKTVKRSFDVAFLMLPDEKLKQKQIRAAKLASLEPELSVEWNPYRNCHKDETDEEIEVRSDSPKNFDMQKLPNHAKFFQSVAQKHQIFDDPNLGKPKTIYEDDMHCYKKKVSLIMSTDQKSAFTKVCLTPKESRMSPNLSISPDSSYQNSLSPSPPILSRGYQNFPSNVLSPNQIFKAQNVTAYQNSFIQDNINSFAAPPSTSLDNPFLVKANGNDLLQPSLAKMRPMLAQYRPDLSPYNYQQFQHQEMLKMAQPDLKFPPDVRNPAAAILTSLLPPSLAALSLPAQNVCAKCNVSFRMTSDLVYHMRSHHKNDSNTDYTKRRREEKLKCPVCAESFRERHHLTRHMTAHQDKEGDSIEPELKKKTFSGFSK